MAAKDAPNIVTVKCKECGSEVSGPDKKAVEATMDRHYRGTGHK